MPQASITATGHMRSHVFAVTELEGLGVCTDWTDLLNGSHPVFIDCPALDMASVHRKAT